jgi:polysaccharide biosynthesis/export protein
MKFQKMLKLNRHGVNRFSLIFLFAAYSSITSCVSLKKVIYFNDLPDTISTPFVINQTPFVDPKIENNDILAITVQTAVQNPGNSPISSTSVGVFNPLNGFLVDRNGYIELSLIGFVKVGGLTTTEARELIKQRADKIYKDPVVNVRIANFDITVLGDVAKPGRVNMPNEKVSIIDAIALSGDLNLTAKRENILLARTEGNETKFVRFDMRSSKIFQSRYFWLKQNDVIYVTPNKFKIQSSDQTFTRNLGILSAIISLASLVLIFRTVK